MQAFLNDPKIKDKYVSRVEAHAQADEIVKGQYWKNGKGCAVGCTIHSSEHKAYETELGIPEWLAYLEDAIFEGLLNQRAKTWPKEFLMAIPVGVDLEKIKVPFLIFVLEFALTTFDHVKYYKVKECIHNVIYFYSSSEADLQKKLETILETVGETATWAESVWTDGATEWEKAWLVTGTDAVWAARAAIWAARGEADGAADGAALAAAATGAVWAAVAAREAAYEKFADKLLELIKEC